MLCVVSLGEEVVVSDKYEELSRLNAKDAIEKFRKSGANHHVTGYAGNRPAYYEELQYWISRNPAVKTQMEDFFEHAEHTVDNVSERRGNLSLLGRMRSEWAVRLLFEEVMKDRRGQETQGYEEVIASWTEEDMQREAHYGFPMFVRNDERAAVMLGKMHLKEVPPYRRSLGGNELKGMREWYPKNKHRLGEVVQATWSNALIEEENVLEVKKKGKKSNLKTSVGSGLGVNEIRGGKSGDVDGSGDEVTEEEVGGGEWVFYVVGGGLLSLLGVSFFRGWGKP